MKSKNKNIFSPKKIIYEKIVHILEYAFFMSKILEKKVKKCNWHDILEYNDSNKKTFTSSLNVTKTSNLIDMRSDRQGTRIGPHLILIICYKYYDKHNIFLYS